MTAQTSETGLLDQKVGDIATSIPGATAVFRRFRISFCCSGDLTLAEAASRRGADPSELERAIQSVQQADSAVAPTDMSDADLIGHITSRYHAAHRQMLPELIALSAKVESVHRHNPNSPAGLAEALEQLGAGLDQQMRDEEETVFPAIRAGDRSAIGEVAGRLGSEHDRQVALLERIEAITDGFQLPEGACRSWQALYLGGARLADDVMAHIHLERSVLLPRLAPSTGGAAGA